MSVRIFNDHVKMRIFINGAEKWKRRGENKNVNGGETAQKQNHCALIFSGCGVWRP
jgi:hypothetical protein